MRIRNFVLIFLAIILVIPLAAIADGLKLEFRLSGGFAAPSIQDPNSMRKGYNRYLTDFAREGGMSRTGAIEEIGPGYEFQGEILIRLGRRFAVGPGVGYVRVRSRGNRVDLASPVRQTRVVLEENSTLIPVMINGYYFLPISLRLRLSLAAGIGYYLASWNWHRSISDRNGFAYVEDGTIDLTAQKLGYQSAIGLEWDISRRFSILIEGFGRFARISGFKSDWTYHEDGSMESGHGRFYYYEWFDSSSGEWYASSSTVAPIADAHTRNIREAIINFSGFSLQAGIKIRL